MRQALRYKGIGNHGRDITALRCVLDFSTSIKLGIVYRPETGAMQVVAILQRQAGPEEILKVGWHTMT